MKFFIVVMMTLLSIASWGSTKLLDVETKTIEIYRRALPSTVNVSNIKLARTFDYGEVEVPQGAGSGYVWDQQGHIITNYHVVQGGSTFVVTFHNDTKQYKAKLVGASPEKDIALHDRLLNNKHMSAFEHQAQPMAYNRRVDHLDY